MRSFFSLAAFSAARNFSEPPVTMAMDQSTQRAKPSFNRSSATLPFYTQKTHSNKVTTTAAATSDLTTTHRMDDAADKVVVVDRLENDLHVAVQQSRLGEELGFLS